MKRPPTVRVSLPTTLVRKAERDFPAAFRQAMPGVRVTRPILLEVLIEEGMLAFTRDIVEGRAAVGAGGSSSRLGYGS